MERKFQTLEELDSQNAKPEVAETVKSPIEVAKEAAEIQKYETERVELQQKAIFAENIITDVKDLKSKLELAKEKESQLEKSKLEWESKKATEQSEIQKQKAELDKYNAELNKKAQELAVRLAAVETREKLVEDREGFLNKTQKEHLENEVKNNSLSEQLKRNLPPVITLMGYSANYLIQAGFSGDGNYIWDELEVINKASGNGDLPQQSNEIVKWLKEDIELCNNRAVEMANNKKQYSPEMYNGIVDNLEKIFELLPVLKLDYLPSDEAIY